MPIRTFVLAATAFGLSILPASATLVISKRATANVTCASGICTGVGKFANLNVTDLQTMLAAGDLTVVSTKKSGYSITVKAPISWANTHTLKLQAGWYGIYFLAPVAVQGAGGLNLITGDGGAYTIGFAKKAAIDFLDTSSPLTINGQIYVLAADLTTLASDVNANPNGYFALARDYDAGPDGVYTHSPVGPLSGTFEGLGHTVKNLAIVDSDRGVHVGMFYQIGSVSDLNISNAHVRAKGTNATVGILGGACGSALYVSISGAVTGARASYIGGACGVLSGNMEIVHSSATVTGDGSTGKALGLLGGLIGFVDGGAISDSYATGKVSGGRAWIAGGLAGETQSEYYEVLSCYATGAVSVGDNGVAGGLIGSNAGTGAFEHTFASGFVGGGIGSTVGGLVGVNNGPISESYASGDVASGSGNAVGGLIGVDLGTADLTNTYWDITTSGQAHGVGNNTAYPGVTGLTTEQFQVGLPDGFDPIYWAENADINGGLPYLVSLPPK